MKEYFHIYPTCPNCHEPHSNGKALSKLDDNRVFCNSCGCHFRKSIDLLDEENFALTVSWVMSHEGEGVRKYLRVMPLPWCVKPNVLEKDYIEWIGEIPPENFLITWPWKKVKFIPLLILQYMEKNPNKRVLLVVENINSQVDTSNIGDPCIKDAIDNLFFVIVNDDINKYPQLKRESGKFDRKYMIEKELTTRYVIHRVGTGLHEEYTSKDGLAHCRRRLDQELNEDFGEECIRRIRTRNLKGLVRDDIKNTNGFIDIDMRETEEWYSSLRYKKDWLWQVLINSHQLRTMKDVCPYTILDASSMRVDTVWKNTLFLISSESSIESLYLAVKRVQPNLIIFESADDFAKEAIFGGKKYSFLCDVLRHGPKASILLFSVDPSLRHLYGINSTSEYFKGCCLNFHTWDCDILIEQLAKQRYLESLFPNPSSSQLNDLIIPKRFPQVEYIKIDCLRTLEEIGRMIMTIIKDEALGHDTKRYLDDLERTPLMLRGDFSRPEVFKRGRLTYDYLMSLLFQLGGQEALDNIQCTITAAFESSTTDLNPSLERILSVCRNQLEKTDTYVTLVTNSLDAKGTQSLISGTDLKNFVPERLSVCSWRYLYTRERELSDTADHIVISTYPPSIEYPIYFSKVARYIFIGSERNLEKIRRIIDTRLTNIRAKPMHLLLGNESAPTLLRKMLERLEVPSNENLSELLVDTTLDLNETPEQIELSFGSIPRLHEQRQPLYYYIQPNDEIILVVDTSKGGMFIPLGSNIFLKEDNLLEEMQIDYNVSDKWIRNNLENKEIIINRYGIYESFRSIFTRLMLTEGKNITFSKGPYKWPNFKSLFEDSILWVNILMDSMQKYALLSNINKDQAEESFSIFLSSLGLTAKDPRYIRGWWSNFENMITEHGEYPLYKVEHPKGLSDIIVMANRIKENIPDADFSELDMEKSYIASILMQNLRRSFIRGNVEMFDGQIRDIYTKVQKQTETIVKTSPIFKVELARKVKASKMVRPYRVVVNFKEFVEPAEDHGK